MTSHAYTSDFDPPAPELPLLVLSHERDTSVLVSALVDTGADVSVLPRDVVDHLGLPAIDHVDVRMTGADAGRVPLHLADVEIAGQRTTIEVLALGSEALIGRNLLASVILVLDGPRRELTVSRR